jgi:hypothetical protein
MIRKIVFTVCFIVSTAMLAGNGAAGVNVNIGINVPPPPPLFIPAPPDVVVIPNTYAYFAPGVDVDIIFYGGYWYRPYEDHWFRARSYNGPWRYIEKHRIPRYIIQLPPDFRRSYHDHPRIPYGHMHKNWNRWQRDKFWDKRHWKHDERDWKHERKEHRRDRKGRHKDERYDDDGRGHGRKDSHRGRHRDD